MICRIRFEHIHVSQMDSYSPPSPGSDFKGNRWQTYSQQFCSKLFSE